MRYLTFVVFCVFGCVSVGDTHHMCDASPTFNHSTLPFAPTIGADTSHTKRLLCEDSASAHDELAFSWANCVSIGPDMWSCTTSDGRVIFVQCIGGTCWYYNA